MQNEGELYRFIQDKVKDLSNAAYHYAGMDAAGQIDWLVTSKAVEFLARECVFQESRADEFYRQIARKDGFEERLSVSECKAEDLALENAELQKALNQAREDRDHNERVIVRLRTEINDLRKPADNAGEISVFDIAADLEKELGAFDVEYKDLSFYRGFDCMVPTEGGVSVCLSLTIGKDGLASVHSGGLFSERVQHRIPLESLIETVRSFVGSFSKTES